MDGAVCCYKQKAEVTRKSGLRAPSDAGGRLAEARKRTGRDLCDLLLYQEMLPKLLVNQT